MNGLRLFLVAAASLVLAGCVVSGGLGTGRYYGHRDHWYYGDRYHWYRGDLPGRYGGLWQRPPTLRWYGYRPHRWHRGHRYGYGGWYHRW